jgi:chromosomal replication initiation ATPase DnaA
MTTHTIPTRARTILAAALRRQELSDDALDAPCRRHAYFRARAEFYWLCRKLLPHRIASLPIIAAWLHQHHTTALHALRRVDDWRGDPAYAADLDACAEALRAELAAGGAAQGEGVGV